MVKKRWKWLLVVSIVLSLAILATGKVYGESRTSIYVSEIGDDSNDGLTVKTPVKTLEKAFGLLTEADKSYVIMIGDGEFPSPGLVYIPENADVLVISSGKSTIYKNPEKPDEEELIKVANSKFKMLEFNNLKFTGDNPETDDVVEQEGTGVYIYNCDYKPGNEVSFYEVEFENLGLGIYQENSYYLTLRIVYSKIKTLSPIKMESGKEFILENSFIEIVDSSGIWSSLVSIYKPLSNVEINENTFVGEQGRGRAIDGKLHNASVEANTFKNLYIAIEAETDNTLIERNHVETNKFGMDLKNMKTNSKLKIIKNTIINKGPKRNESLGLKVRNDNNELENTEFDIQGNRIINFDIALDFDSYNAPNTSFVLGQAGAENTFAGNFVNLVLQREWKNDDPEAKLDLSHNDWGTTDPEEVRTRIDASEEFLNQFVVLAEQPITKLPTLISVDSSYTENNADEYKYGHDAFNNIDEALAYLASGGLILVNDGTYEAPLWIDRPMHIKGNGDQVKLVEDGSLAAETQSEMITVVAPGLKFENLHFDGKYIGLRFKDYRPKQYNVKQYESVAHTFEVTDCTFTGFKSVAINAWFSYDYSEKTFDNAKIVIKDNDISRYLDEKYSYGTGISLGLYDIDIDVEIENNKIHGDYVRGIYLRYGNNAVVKNNDVKVSPYSSSDEHYGINVSVGGNVLIVDNHIENQLENEDVLDTRGINLNVDDENNKNIFSNRVKGFGVGIHVYGPNKLDYSNIVVGGSEPNANDLSDNRYGLAASLSDLNEQSLNATYNQWGVADADLPGYIKDENYRPDYSSVDYFPSVLSPLSDDANLKSLSATGLLLTPEFDPDTLTYTATVTYYLNRTTVSAETNDISAKTEINDLNVKQLLVDLIVGNNTIEVKVVSPDGTKTQTYTLNINRQPEPEPEEPPYIPEPEEPPYVPEKEEPPVIEVEVETNVVDGNTTNSVQVESDEESGAQLGEEIVDALLKKAEETDGNKTNDLIEISVDTPADVDDVLLTIPDRELNRLTDETSASFGLKTSFVKITFDNKALSTIAKTESSGDISILASKVLGQDERPIYDVTVKKGEAAVEDLQGGKAFVTAPYEPRADENENAIVVYGIDDDGSRKIMRGRYESEQASMVFRTGYFYKFVVAHNLVKFDDVKETSWYKDSVDFIAAREITQGIDKNNFGPQQNLTRAQFVVLLLNAYQIELTEAEKTETDNFADVGESYYTDHLLTAKALGIVNGIGNNEFAPEREITRQEMFVMLYNILQFIDEMPEEINTIEPDNYFDADEIAVWAKEATAALIKTETIVGYANKLMPQATSTRAEMAQVIYNLLTK